MRKRLYRRFFLIAAATLAIALGTVPFVAEPAKSQAALQVVEKRNMKFGTWASDVDGPGSVVLSPNSDSAVGSGSVYAFGGNVKRARFQLIGEPKAYVIVTLPSSITIRKGSSGHTMTVDNFTMDNSNPIRLSKKGKKTINIGATIHVNRNQRRGNYNDENEFTVFADYQ